MNTVYEVINRRRVEDDRDATRSAYLALEHAIKAEAIAEVMRALSPDGQDIKYDDLTVLHDRLEGQE